MVSVEIDHNLSQREDDAALARWAPKALQEVARVFGRINSGLILENRLGLSLSNLRQRGEELRTSLATGGAAVPRSIAPLRYAGLDLYGSELMAMMSIETISSDYRRRPVLTTLPTVESYAPEGSTITAGTIVIDNAPPDSDLKPGVFVTMLEWTSAARTMADPSTWTAIDEASAPASNQRRFDCCFQRCSSQQFHGTLALRLCRDSYRAARRGQCHDKGG